MLEAILAETELVTELPSPPELEVLQYDEAEKALRQVYREDGVESSR